MALERPSVTFDDRWYKLTPSASKPNTTHTRAAKGEVDMSANNGLIRAYILDGEGGSRTVGWDEIENWQPSQGLLWIHLDRAELEARRWLRDSSGLNPVIVDALLAKGSRPRALAVGEDLLVFLRGINLNPGEDPVHMVSMRMYLSADRIVSVRRQNLLAVGDLSSSLEEGTGPGNAGEFLVRAAEALTNCMSPKLTDLKDELDQLEEEMARTDYSPSRPRLASIQREAIALRRYLAPQRDALNFLCSTPTPWLTGNDRMRLYETIDQVTRYVEN